MSVLVSKVSTRGSDFQQQQAAMQALVDEVRDLEGRVRIHGAKAAGRFESRGQLTPRERVERLIDVGSDFLELSSLAGLRMHDDDGNRTISGGGNIVGVGFVSGVRCMITASDAAIKGGSVTPMGLKKSLRAQEIAMKERLPSIALIESGGANLLYQAEIFIEGGRVFANMARMSAAGLPQITVVHGSSTAGGAYLPGLSDYVVAVKKRAKIFLAGPPLVEAALGERTSEAELGGAEMHSSVSGTVEYLAEDDDHALQTAREIVASLGWDKASKSECVFLEPVRSPEELVGAVPADTRQPYDMREILARVLDGSDFLEFKAGFGSQTVCGHGAICGHRVGLIGNNGPVFPDGSVKAAHFIQLCEQAGLPLVFFMNTTGYMVGRAAEQGGAVKHGAKMIQAVANARVPKLTVVVGGAYGAGNYGMCGRGFDPDFLFAWPNAKVAVMGGEQAAMVMKIITRAKLERMGLPIDESAIDAMTGEVASRLDREASALFATARLWDDGLIDPRQTRDVLAFCLDTCRDAQKRILRTNTFGVARG